MVAAIPLPEPRQELIADHSATRSEIIERHRRAKEFRLDAGMDSVLGQVGDVGDRQVHRDPADERAAWQKLWGKVEGTLKKAQEKAN